MFTGFQSGDDLGRAVASMDVFFNPSVTETFGNVTTEAMAAGVPVVAARATGAVDLVEDGRTGFLVPPRDVAAYADAIARIVGDPALRRDDGRSRARGGGGVPLGHRQYGGTGDVAGDASASGPTLAPPRRRPGPSGDAARDLAPAFAGEARRARS